MTLRGERTDWRAARSAVKEGKAVFFPRLTVRQTWSIFAHDRKFGLRLQIKRIVHQQALGCVAWKLDEDPAE